MEELFKKRQLAFIKQINRYLPYVFNDHFVLVLLFLAGFLMFQYSELLKHFPENPFLVIFGLVAVVLLLLYMGSIALYLEKADKQFLLVKENELKLIVQQALKRSFLVWGSLQTVVLLFLTPLFLKIGFDMLSFLLLLIGLLGVKWFVMRYKSQYFFSDGELLWDKALFYEIKRKQSILKFFSLFTTVKGVSTTVKRRKYLDTFLRFVEKKHQNVWVNLYLRAFFRSSDYFMLTVRLLVLAILSLFFIKHTIIALGLVFVFDYLLIFQLLTLFNHYDYHYGTRLYPISKQMKLANLKSFLRQIIIVVVACELLCGLWINYQFIALVIVMIFMEFYLPYKLRKMID